MATLDTISTITKIEIPLEWNEFEEREFYAMPSFMRFISETLPTLGHGALPDIKDTPRQQMDGILRKWIVGRPMQYGRMFKTMKPSQKQVWEMKTPDLRIFGWLYRPRLFVAAFVGVADDYKEQNGQPPKETYDDARDRVVRLRDSLNLDEPKFVTGDYNALV